MVSVALYLKSAARWFKLESKQGVSAIEYGLLAALIFVVIIASMKITGTNLQGLFRSIASQVHS